MKKLLLAVAILSLTGLQQPAFAHEGEEHGAQPHQEPAAEAAMPAMTVQDALSSIQASMAIVSSQVDTEQFDAIHAEIEKIDTATKVLKSTAAVREDKKLRLESSINQFVVQLGKLHTVADAKDAEKSKTELKKAQGALKLVESHLK